MARGHLYKILSEDLSLIPRTNVKRRRTPGVATHVCHPRHGEVGTDGSLSLASRQRDPGVEREKTGSWLSSPFFAEDPDLVASLHIWWLTPTCHPRFVDSNATLWPPRACALM